jgi:hypothetical protein
VLTILIRSIFAASLKRVKIFEGAGGEGLGKAGNTISWTLAILSVIGLFYVKGDRDVSTFLENVLGPAGIYAVIVIIGFLFFWLKGATGSTGWAVVLSGAIAMLISNNVDWPALASIGLLMVIVGFIMLAFKLAGWRKPATQRDLNRAASDENTLSNALTNLSHDVGDDIDLGMPDRKEAAFTVNEKEGANLQRKLLTDLRASLQRGDPSVLGHIRDQMLVALEKEEEMIEDDLPFVETLDSNLKKRCKREKVDLNRILKDIEVSKDHWQKIANLDDNLKDEHKYALALLKEVVDAERAYADLWDKIQQTEENWNDCNKDIMKFNKDIRDVLNGMKGADSTKIIEAIKQMRGLITKKLRKYSTKDRAIDDYRGYEVRLLDLATKLVRSANKLRVEENKMNAMLRKFKLID